VTSDDELAGSLGNEPDAVFVNLDLSGNTDTRGTLRLGNTLPGTGAV